MKYSHINGFEYTACNVVIYKDVEQLRRKELAIVSLSATNFYCNKIPHQNDVPQHVLEDVPQVHHHFISYS